MREEVDAMLAASPEAGAEEWTMFNTRRNQMKPKGNGGGTYTMTIDTENKRKELVDILGEERKHIPYLLTSYEEALDVIDAQKEEIERLRTVVGELKGAVNWLDALLELIEETSCDPDDPKRFDEVVVGATLFGRSARAALSEREP